MSECLNVLGGIWRGGAGLYLEHLVEVLAAEHIMTIMTMAENCISFICMQRYTKKLSYVKYSSKRSDFLRLYLYLCYVIDDFACLEMQH